MRAGESKYFILVEVNIVDECHIIQVYSKTSSRKVSKCQLRIIINVNLQNREVTILLGATQQKAAHSNFGKKRVNYCTSAHTRSLYLLIQQLKLILVHKLELKPIHKLKLNLKLNLN